MPLQRILAANRDALDAAVEAILVKETLTGDELLDIMARHPASAADVTELEGARVRDAENSFRQTSWVYGLP